MTPFEFDVNEVVKSYSTKDYERQYDNPRSDTFFEFEIGEATLGQAKINEEKGTGGYLQLSLKANALNNRGETMFTKFVNLALPVSYRGYTPHESAGSILASTLKAIHPELRPFDEVTEDATNPKKKIYLLKGEPVSKEAFKAAEKAQAQMVVDTLDNLLSSDKQETTLQELVGRRFFAKVQPDKTGQFFNVRPIVGRVGPNDTVCYDIKEAFNR